MRTLKEIFDDIEKYAEIQAKLAHIIKKHYENMAKKIPEGDRVFEKQIHLGYVLQKGALTEDGGIT